MDASASAINDQMAAVSLAPAFARAEPLKGAAVLYAKDLDGSDGAWVGSGFSTVKAAIESQYACLGITCADVGGMLADGAPIPGFEPCVDGAELAPDRGEYTPMSARVELGFGKG